MTGRSAGERVLVVKLGSTVPGLVPRRGDFDDWFRTGFAPLECDVVLPHAGELLPEVGLHAGVVLTGSSAMVTDETDWSRRVAAWLADVVRAQTPVLGVCYGHQLLAHALGGEVGWNEYGREIGTVEVELTPEGRRDPLFAGLSSPLVVQSSHAQSVLVLPPHARRLAHNAHDDHQAFAIGDHAWGVQFHPEFDADIARAYVVERREELVEEGLDPAGLDANVRESDDGRAILAAFAECVRSHSR